MALWLATVISLSLVLSPTVHGLTFLRTGIVKLSYASKTSEYDEEHLAHSIQQVHEETAEELWESEQAAAIDARDSSDAGMEAAAEERAVMMAHEWTHKMKRDKASEEK